MPNWDWYTLPKTYLRSPYLSADNEALTTYFQEGGIALEEDESESSTAEMRSSECSGSEQLDGVDGDKPPSLDEDGGSNGISMEWSDIPKKTKVCPSTDQSVLAIHRH